MGAFPGDQSLKTDPDEGGFLRDARQPRRLLKKGIVYVESRSHAYQYVLFIHIMSSELAVQTLGVRTLCDIGVKRNKR